MTCQEFWSQMPELETGQQQFDHVRQCASCAALLERQSALSAGLRLMAAQRHTVEAPAYLEAGLRAMFHTPAGRPAKSPSFHWWVPAVAALLALAVFLVWERRPQSAGRSGAPPVYIASVTGDDAAEMDSGFIALPYADATGAPDDGDRVQIEVPRATLIALGIPMPEGEAGEAVEAEVSLGAGGAPQAVRLLE